MRQPVAINNGHLKKNTQHWTHDPERTQAKQQRQLKKWMKGDTTTGSINGGLTPKMCLFGNCLDCFLKNMII